jgi:hypothetical protein
MIIFEFVGSVCLLGAASSSKRKGVAEEGEEAVAKDKSGEIRRD